MIIQDGILLYVDQTDLDKSGTLRIPEGVKEIAENVGNSLPGLKCLYLPDSLKEIRKKIFCNNHDLTALWIGKNTTFIDYGSFYECCNINKIALPNTGVNMIYPTIFPKLRLIIHRYPDNTQKEFHIKKYSGLYYYEESSRKIGNIQISKIYTVFFHDDFTKSPSKTRLIIKSKDQKTFIGDNLQKAIIECRKYFLMQEFEHAIWKYKVTHDIDEYSFEGHENVLRNAIKKHIQNPTIKPLKNRLETAREHIKKIPLYIKQLEKFCKKYQNSNDYLGELVEISMESLLQKITPIKNKPKTVVKSCTHWLKKHPVSASEMYSIVRAGYKNPGSFPYSWLKEIPKSQRGKATLRLHKIFKQATIKMYSPDIPKLQPFVNGSILSELSNKISKTIKQPVQIKYLGSGTFSKTYEIQIPEDRKYVWKIYHCDTDDSIVSSYYHDTELQNSFLFGGKKYYGSTKFRRISTAGISNQRGEIYLIYPYTEATPNKEKIYRDFESTRKYTLVDRNSDNFLGNTIIDTGAIRINYDNWGQPRYVSKITNTILYQSWNALGYVLNNYSCRQIHNALTFIEGKTSVNNLEFNTIQSKIDFLKQKIKTR